MNGTDRYEIWRRRRSAVDAPPGFADGVMQLLESPEDVASVPTISRPKLRHRIWNGCVAASVVAACLGIGLLRIQTLMALVLATSSEGL